MCSFCLISDYMYRGFVFAQDAITEFVRSLENADKIAFYSYSRDLSRAATLTSDRGEVVKAVRSTVAGDEAALYNALLLEKMRRRIRVGRLSSYSRMVPTTQASCRRRMSPSSRNQPEFRSI